MKTLVSILLLTAACSAPHNKVICMPYDGPHAADIQAGVALWESTKETEATWSCFNADISISIVSVPGADWRGNTLIRTGRAIRMDLNLATIDDTHSDWSSVAAHEYGHALGLNHGGTDSAIMFAPSGYCLDRDDVEQLCNTIGCVHDHSHYQDQCLDSRQ